MYVRTTYGSVWVSHNAPYYRNWQGKMAHRYLMSRQQPAGRTTSTSE